MSEAGGGGETADVVPQLSGLLLAEETVSGLLDAIVNLAVAAVDGLAGASVSLVLRDGERLETTSASSEAIRHVDQAQYAIRAGPCVEAIRTGQEVQLAMPTARWPEFGERATHAGARSVWSLPLVVRDRTTGALNLYSRRAQGWEQPVAGTARGLAGQATVVLANAVALMSAQLANQHLQAALESRDVIG
jgi:GAF domain-containing protein